MPRSLSNLYQGNYEQNLMPRGNQGLGLQDVVNMQFRLNQQNMERSDLQAARGVTSVISRFKTLEEEGDPVKYNGFYQLMSQMPRIQTIFEKAGIPFETYDPKYVAFKGEDAAIKKAELEAKAKTAGAIAGANYKPEEQKAIQDRRSLEEYQRDQRPVQVTTPGTSELINTTAGIAKEVQLGAFREQQQMKKALIEDGLTPGYVRDDRGLLQPITKAKALGKEFVEKKEGDEENKIKDTYESQFLTVASAWLERPDMIRQMTIDAFDSPESVLNRVQNGPSKFVTDLASNYRNFGDKYRRGVAEAEYKIAQDLIHNYNEEKIKAHPELAERRKAMIAALDNSEIAALPKTVKDSLGREYTEYIHVPSPFLFYALDRNIDKEYFKKSPVGPATSPAPFPLFH